MHMLFYEKPGCGNNQRQKAELRAAGYELEARDILTEAWTASRLQRFFAALPVADCFNRAAPRVKSGAVIPESLDRRAALALMLDDPLLIRRPLIEADGQCTVGFDAEVRVRWLGAHHRATVTEACPRATRGDHPPRPPPLADHAH